MTNEKIANVIWSEFGSYKSDLPLYDCVLLIEAIELALDQAEKRGVKDGAEKAAVLADQIDPDIADEIRKAVKDLE